MFEKVRAWWRDLSIDAAFPAYEAQQRAAHTETANRRLSTEELRAELQRLTTPYKRRCEEVFGGPIAVVQDAISRLQLTLDEVQEQIHVLEADFNGQVKPLYKRDRDIRQRCDVLVTEKRQAADDLETARHNITSWHSKSTSSGFFGNGGRSLPEHSLFGQSFGDLDGHKSDRASAVHAFGIAKEALNELHEERTELQAEISRLKTGRDRQRELLRTGLRLPALRAAVQRTAERLEEQCEILRRMEACRATFLEKGWHQSRAKEVQDAIAARESARLDFLRTFDTEEAKLRRKETHRANFRR